MPQQQGKQDISRESYTKKNTKSPVKHEVQHKAGASRNNKTKEVWHKTLVKQWSDTITGQQEKTRHKKRYTKDP